MSRARKEEQRLQYSEDQVSRTPRARRTEAAKQKFVNSDIVYDQNDNPTALTTRQGTADDLEGTDMLTVRKMTPK